MYKYGQSSIDTIDTGVFLFGPSTNPLLKWSQAIDKKNCTRNSTGFKLLIINKNLHIGLLCLGSAWPI